jgi:regulator of replication initiation timing
LNIRLNTNQIINQIRNEQLMMKINTQKLVKFAESVKAIMNNDVTLKVNNNQLEIIQMDGSHICLIHYSIALEEPSQNCEFSLNINDLYNMLKPIKDEFVILKIDGKILKIESNSSNVEVNLIDLEQEVIDVECLNQIPFSQTFTLNYKTFESMIIAVKPISEVVEFEISNSDIRFIAESKVGKINQKILWDHSQSIEFCDTFKCSYAIQFLHNLRKTFNFLKIGLTNKEKADLSIQLTFKAESPLKLECYDQKGSFMKAFLAPRVEEDSDSEEEEEISTSIQKSNEEINSIHSDPNIAHKIEINKVIIQAQINKALEIEQLEANIALLTEQYESYDEKLLRLRSELTNSHEKLTQLENQFI